MNTSSSMGAWQQRCFASVMTYESAVAHDRELRSLATASCRVQRMMGKALARLFDSGRLLEATGFQLQKDYVRECHGISVRHAQELARIERLMPQYPETERLWKAGRILWSHVREIVGRVVPENEAPWAMLAAVMSVRELIDRLRAEGMKAPGCADGVVEGGVVSPVGGGASGESSAGDTEDDGGTMLEVRMSPQMHLNWKQAVEIASRLCETDLQPHQVIEALVAEAHSSAPHYMQAPSYVGRDEDDVPSSTWRAEMAQEMAHRTEEAERALERSTRRWARLDWSVEAPEAPEMAVGADDDPRTVHDKLSKACKVYQETSSSLVPRLGEARRGNLAEVLEFDSMVHYGRERLGMSPSRVRAALRLAVGFDRFPLVAAAYASGELSQCKAELVVRIAGQESEAEWVKYARKVTVRHLQTVVAGAGKADPGRPDRWPPALEGLPTSPLAVEALEEAMAKVAEVAGEGEGSAAEETAGEGQPTCAHGLGATDESGKCDRCELTCAPPPGAERVSDDMWALGREPVTVRFYLPQDVQEFLEDGMSLCRVQLGASAGVSRCLELLVNNFISVYEQQWASFKKEHPVVERDGCRCAVPGCTSRKGLQAHHLKFRSHGGGNEVSNLITLCAAHHQHGIHAGVIRARGLAPGEIVWELGVSPDRLPVFVFVGDQVVYPAA